MRLAEAKDLVLRLIMTGQSDAAWSLLISPASPDSDAGKFLIDGKVARAIQGPSTALAAGTCRSIRDGSAEVTISRSSMGPPAGRAARCGRRSYPSPVQFQNPS